jgi:hypothetical protein
MLRCAVLALAAIFSIAAPAAEPEESGLQIWVNPGMFSDHEKTTATTARRTTA